MPTFPPPQSSPWRLLPYIQAPGNLQMALDQWLLEDYFPRTGRSVLRFYGWSRPTISLGYSQKSPPAHWRQLTWQGQPLGLVSRPSGGRAVLHQGGLTYAVVTGATGKKRREIYRHICQFLIQGWGQLGLPLTYGQGGRGYIHNASCFSTATVADLVSSTGDKLIGSAQRQTFSALLQHGEMILNGDRHLFELVFGQPAPWQKTMAELTGYPTLPQVLEVLTTSARQHFQAQVQWEPLTLQEWAMVKEKCRNAKADFGWTPYPL
ncbi:lipoyl protein ligase domain-containing protein [Synechocystis salina]|nr:biotin/lipoate A/B protein ligase family protein [Synechocystis salina]